MKSALLLACALCVAPLYALAAEPAKPSIAVLDFTASGASNEIASAVTGVTANELERIGLFKVVTGDTVRSLLALERQKQLLGCSEETSCMAEIAGALGVQYAISGKVTKLGGSGGKAAYTLELALMNVAKAQREGSQVETADSEVALMNAASKGLVKLLGKQLSSRSGTLIVNTQESGAAVKIDGTLKGTTPLPGRLELPAGPHLLTVEKEGFVAFEKEVRVQPAQLSEETVQLVPSPDFIKNYESTQKAMRVGAWATTGVAAASLVAAAYLQLDARSLYGDAGKPGTFLFHRGKLQSGIESEGGVNHREELTRLKGRIDGAQTGSLVSAGLFGAAAAGALYFWSAGEDPDRYSRYRTVEPTAVLVPSPNGAAAVFTWELP